MKRTIVDTRIQAMAVQAGLLKPGEPITPSIRMLADLVALHCADIALSHCVDDERRLDIEIKSAFGLLT